MTVRGTRSPKTSQFSLRRIPSNSRGPTRCRKRSSTGSFLKFTWVIHPRKTKPKFFRDTRQVSPPGDSTKSRSPRSIPRCSQRRGKRWNAFASSRRFAPTWFRSRGALAIGRRSLWERVRALAGMDGRDYLLPDDVKNAALPVLRHRILLKPEADLEGLTSDQVIKQVIGAVEVPK